MRLNLILSSRNSKKANLLSIWWFVSLIIIALGVAGGVITFYSQTIDVRGIEADIMSDKVISCLFDKSNNNNTFFNELKEGKIDVLRVCNLNEQSFREGSDYFIKVSIKDEKENLINETRYGNNAIEANCEIKEDVEAKKFPTCSPVSTLVFIDDIKYKIEVLAASNAQGKAVEEQK